MYLLTKDNVIIYILSYKNIKRIFLPLTNSYYERNSGNLKK